LIVCGWNASTAAPRLGPYRNYETSGRGARRSFGRQGDLILVPRFNEPRWEGGRTCRNPRDPTVLVPETAKTSL